MAYEKLYKHLFVTLKDYIDVRVHSVERASEITSIALDKRLDGMNEFRAQLKDQASTFVIRSEYQLGHEKLCDDIKRIDKVQAIAEGKASQSSVVIAYVIAVVGIIISVISLIKIYIK